MPNVSARELARRAFWCLGHPFTKVATDALGRVYSLKESISFAESLPAEQIAAIAAQAARFDLSTRCAPEDS